MTSFKAYFNYIFKRSSMRLLVTLAIAVTVTMWEALLAKEDSNMQTVSIILRLLCTVVPPLELCTFKNRRNADILFSLPVSRKKQALAHYLNGLIQVIVTYACCFAAVTIYYSLALKKENLQYYFVYFLLSLILSTFIYSVLMFAFNQANTVIDGIIFELLVGFGGIWVMAFVSVLFDLKWGLIYCSLYAPLGVDGLFQIVKENSFIMATGGVWLCVAWSIIGVACLVGYFITFDRIRAEKIGGISDSVFGYKTLIPIWAYTLLATLGGLLCVFIYICMLVGYIIFRRGFKLTKNDYLTMLCSLPFLVLGFTWMY